MPDYSETGFLSFLELDSPNQANFICLSKFTAPVSTTQGYQVNLMNLKRDLSQINWMLRYQNNYQAEAKLMTNIYLMITRGPDLYFQIINPLNGSTISQVHYTLGNNEYLYYPQMAISSRYNTIFFVKLCKKHCCVSYSLTKFTNENLFVQYIWFIKNEWKLYIFSS